MKNKTVYDSLNSDYNTFAFIKIFFILKSFYSLLTMKLSKGLKTQSN